MLSNGKRYSSVIESCAITDPGGRTENQDRLLADKSLGLFAVADGMGGHRAGSFAAELAISTLRYYVESSTSGANGSGAWPFGYLPDVSEQGNRLSTGIRLAHRSVLREGASSPEYAGMGTTMAALLLHEGTSTVANVGDSRVYLFRDGTLTQLSHDDTLTDSDLGSLITNEEFRQQMKNVLIQAIGVQEDLDVHVCERRIGAGDMLLLCSDGLHGPLGDELICEVLRRGASVDKLGEDLLKAAIEHGASDNVSVVLLACDGKA